MNMEEETSRKIKETVTEILREANMEEMTEFKVRVAASERLGCDLSDVEHKKIIRGVVESFLLSMVDDSVEGKDAISNVQEELEEAAQELQEAVRVKAIDGYGELHICKLSSKRSVVVHGFRGKTYISVREYYLKDGKRLPSSKGISLTSENWSTLKKNVPAIEEAIAKLQSKIRPQLDGEQQGDVSNPTTSATQDNACNEIAHVCWMSHLNGEQRRDESNSITSASQEFVPIETTRFDGKNYHSWAAKMELFLNQLSISYVLTNPCPTVSPGSSNVQNAQAKAAVQKWVNDDYLCRHNILNSLSDPLYHQFSKKAGNAKELWEELKFVYLYEEFGSKRSQVRKYLEFQMDEGKPILDQVQELNGIADSLAAAGMMIPENFHVTAIIFKLPPSWKDFCIKFLREEYLPFWMLMDQIRLEEETRKGDERGDYSNSTSYHAARNSGPRAMDVKKPYVPHHKREADLQRKGSVCDYCGRKGHLSKVCWNRKSGKEVNEKPSGGNLNMPAVVADANMVESRSFN